jgi:hypothetical protein
VRVVRRSSLVGAALAAAMTLVPFAVAGGVTASLPNACTVLASANPQTAFGHGTAAAGKAKLQTYASGKYASASCTQMIGSQTVVLSLSLAGPGGFGGVKITSTSHPKGLGSEDSLIVGTGEGSGAAVDFVTFHRGSIYADLSANGASPTKLTAFAKAVYRLLH